MTIEQIGTLVNSGGVVLLLVAALVGGARRWWVYGQNYVDMVADRDRWRDIALRGISAAEKATVVAEHTLRNGGSK